MKDRVDIVNQNLAGIQLALFELIWPSFTWIDRLYVASDPERCSVHVQYGQAPPSKDWVDCRRMLGEIFDDLLKGSGATFIATHGERPPTETAYKELMSEEIFRAIAKDVAPWRLDAGR